MKKWTVCGIVLLLVLSLLAGCKKEDPENTLENTKEETVESPKESTIEETEAEEVAPVTVLSVFGEEEREITYEKVPERVVSLAGFATEMLLALGLEDKIVGYAWQDNEVLPKYKEKFEALTPLCDPGMDPGEEKMLAAQPDLVLSWASWSDDDYFSFENLNKNRIQTYGFHCERYEGATLQDVYDDFLNLGKIFRVEEKAENLVKQMKQRISFTEKRVAGLKPAKVFVCDISSTEEEAFTVGGGLPAELIALAGGKNVIEDGKNWTRVSWEVVAEANPDWIIIDYYTNADDVDGTIDFLKNHPAMSKLEAVQKEKFIILGLTDISASERNDDTVEMLANYFHPVK